MLVLQDSEARHSIDVPHVRESFTFAQRLDRSDHVDLESSPEPARRTQRWLFNITPQHDRPNPEISDRAENFSEDQTTQAGQSDQSERYNDQENLVDVQIQDRTDSKDSNDQSEQYDDEENIVKLQIQDRSEEKNSNEPDVPAESARVDDQAYAAIPEIHPKAERTDSATESTLDLDRPDDDSNADALSCESENTTRKDSSDNEARPALPTTEEQLEIIEENPEMIEENGEVTNGEELASNPSQNPNNRLVNASLPQSVSIDYASYGEQTEPHSSGFYEEKTEPHSSGLSAAYRQIAAAEEAIAELEEALRGSPSSSPHQQIVVQDSDSDSGEEPIVFRSMEAEKLRLKDLPLDDRSKPSIALCTPPVIRVKFPSPLSDPYIIYSCVWQSEGRFQN